MSLDSWGQVGVVAAMFAFWGVSICCSCRRCHVGPRHQTYLPWAAVFFGKRTVGWEVAVQSPKLWIAFESKLTLTVCFSLALSIKIHQTVPSHLAMTWNKNFELLTFSGMTGLQPPFLQTFNPHRCGLGNPTCLLPPIPTLPSRC